MTWDDIRDRVTAALELVEKDWLRDGHLTAATADKVIEAPALLRMEREGIR